ncbi:hypothetical protein HK098_004103 [Nowakowskiella sp. JEL0407]|nr:hypothetical protein HK098_004103 [Nowakowskiella sp. JEL0407]
MIHSTGKDPKIFQGVLLSPTVLFVKPHRKSVFPQMTLLLRLTFICILLCFYHVQIFAQSPSGTTSAVSPTTTSTTTVPVTTLTVVPTTIASTTTVAITTQIVRTTVSSAGTTTSDDEFTPTTTASTKTPSASPKPKTDVSPSPALLFGVGGGVAFIVLVASAVFVWNWYKKRQEDAEFLRNQAKMGPQPLTEPPVHSELPLKQSNPRPGQTAYFVENDGVGHGQTSGAVYAEPYDPRMQPNQGSMYPVNPYPVQQAGYAEQYDPYGREDNAYITGPRDGYPNQGYPQQQGYYPPPQSYAGSSNYHPAQPQSDYTNQGQFYDQGGRNQHYYEQGGQYGNRN